MFSSGGVGAVTADLASNLLLWFDQLVTGDDAVDAVLFRRAVPAPPHRLGLTSASLQTRRHLVAKERAPCGRIHGKRLCIYTCIGRGQMHSLDTTTDARQGKNVHRCLRRPSHAFFWLIDYLVVSRSKSQTENGAEGVHVASRS